MTEENKKDKKDTVTIDGIEWQKNQVWLAYTARLVVYFWYAIKLLVMVISIIVTILLIFVSVNNSSKRDQEEKDNDTYLLGEIRELFA